ncbi:MAG: DUF5711 family protein, partial [Bacillota bacterium]|nr:DUF5711 family protein [Bacillota bacterium]
MARKRKGRLVSIILFIIINIIVFNRGTIYGNIKSIIGFGDMQISELKTVEFEYDVERGIIPKIFILDEYILSVVDTKITLFTDEGEAKWQQTNDFEDLLVDGNENFFAVVDYLKGDIYIYDYRGNVNASLLGTGEISSLKVTKEGYIMVLLDTSNSILIYDPQLNLVSQVNINKGDVSSFDFNEKTHFLYIGTLNMEEKQLNSYIYKYDLMGHLIGSVKLMDEILFEIYFDGLNFIKISDKEIGTYNENMELIDSVNSIGNVDLIAYKDDLLVTQTLDKSSEVIKNNNKYDSIGFDLSKNEVVFRKSYKENYQEIVFRNDDFICYNNNVIDIFNRDD